MFYFEGAETPHRRFIIFFFARVKKNYRNPMFFLTIPKMLKRTWVTFFLGRLKITNASNSLAMTRIVQAACLYGFSASKTCIKTTWKSCFSRSNAFQVIRVNDTRASTPSSTWFNLNDHPTTKCHSCLAWAVAKQNNVNMRKLEKY